MSIKIIRDLKKLVKRIVAPKIPAHIAKNFRYIDDAAVDRVASSLKLHYFTRQIWAEAPVTADTWLSSDEGKNDLRAHLYGRLDSFRMKVIPWLDDAKPLAGSRILEIGCGTGASTVALAEQGAEVVGVDIDEKNIAVAKDRCKEYGLGVNFYKANAADAHNLFSGQRFDFIIFFACLEHMTNSERIAAIKNTWNMLSKNGLWCVIETPNRLWYFDNHTSILPFYFWLPDDIAFMYSQFSPRRPFCGAYRDHTESAMLNFLRHGRGVSFHEFDLAIGRTEKLKVVSSLRSHLRRGSLYKIYDFFKKIATKNDYGSFLARVGPKIHKGFYEPSLDLIIRKD